MMEVAAINDYSDTKEIVSFADKVYGVISPESTIKPLDNHSIAYFKSLCKKFAGAVLNRMDTKDLKLLFLLDCYLLNSSSFWRRILFAIDFAVAASSSFLRL